MSPAPLPRRRPQAESIAANALDFGTPVLESALTLIENGHLYYRGQDATLLARTASAGSIAQIPWDGDERPFAARNLPADVERFARRLAGVAVLPPVDSLVLLPAAARWDHPELVEDRDAMLETGGVS